MTDLTTLSSPAGAAAAGPVRKRSLLRRVLLGAGALVAVVLVVGAIFVAVEASAYDASMDKVYDVPLPAIMHSTDPAVIERGKHVADTIGSCANGGCHGADLGGGTTIRLGPLGQFTGPNISMGGLGVAYSDSELARLIKHGIKRDGRSVRFMPIEDFRWLPDGDLTAVVSFIRASPPVDRANGTTSFSALGKVLDRRGVVTLDVARHVDHNAVLPTPPAPAPTAEYGGFVAKGCTGCHGEHLSGGPIPGAPPSMPVPLNLTPGIDGLAKFTFADFDRSLTDGVKPDGAKLNPFMPANFGRLDDTEKHALWAYLQTLPPRPFGQR